MKLRFLRSFCPQKVVMRWTDAICVVLMGVGPIANLESCPDLSLALLSMVVMVVAFVAALL